MENDNKISIPLVFSGLLVLSFCIGSTVISYQFVYGLDHENRPIFTFLLFYFIGWIGMTGGLLSVRSINRSRLITGWIIGVAVLSRLILLPSNLILENDCYRYVLDGEAVVHRVNPYATPPLDIVYEAPQHFKDELSSAQAKLILSRIGYPEVPTVYPPLAQFFFAAGAWLTPWNWMGQRIVFLSLDIATIAIIILLLSKMGKPLPWVLLYAWNPLILKEIANSAHLDSLVGLCLVLLTLCCCIWNKSRTPIWLVFSGIGFAGAILAKFYPLILAPIYLAYFFRGNKRWMNMLIFLTATVVTVGLLYLPFVDIGFENVTRGLRTYSQEWVLNEGAFYILTLLGNLFGDRFGLPLNRLMALAIISILSVGLAYRITVSDVDADSRLIAATQITLTIWFLLLPAVFPWYAIGLIAISTLRPNKLIVVLSGIMGLYYLIFLISYRDYPEYWYGVVQVIEHGVLWLGLLAGIVIGIIQRQNVRDTIRKND